MFVGHLVIVLRQLDGFTVGPADPALGIALDNKLVFYRPRNGQWIVGPRGNVWCTVIRERTADTLHVNGHFGFGVPETWNGRRTGGAVVIRRRGCWMPYDSLAAALDGTRSVALVPYAAATSP